MKATAASRAPQAVSLFEHGAEASSRDVARKRVAQFAFAVARRHLAEHGARCERGDRARMLSALRGYYRTWTLCTPTCLPGLDEELEAVASAAYACGCGVRERPVAA